MKKIEMVALDSADCAGVTGGTPWLTMPNVFAFAVFGDFGRGFLDGFYAAVWGPYGNW